MTIKLLFSNYDKETKISTVLINTDLGIFKGQVILKEEDYDIESKFAGCEYAEMKAIIKYLKEKRKNINIEIKNTNNILNMLKNYKEFNSKSFEFKKINKYLYKLEKDKKNINTKIENLSKRMLSDMETRRTFLEKYNKLTKKGE